jgi:hypothetical protein
MSGRYFYGLFLPGASLRMRIQKTRAEGCDVLQCGKSEGWQRWIGACDAENGGWNPAYELISTDQSLKGSEKQRQGEWQQRSTSLVQASWRQYHYRSLFPAGAVA